MLIFRRLLLCTAALSLAYAATPFAQPSQEARPAQHALGPTIADQEHATYRFERFTLHSEDGQRHYRVQVAIPKRPAPATGFPVIYMLDGNAALAAMDAADLAAVDALSPTVLVAIGYEVEGSHDTTARAFDYTPPVIENGVERHDVEVRGRLGGGAALFLDYIEQRIKPEVDARAPTDHSRQTLWGHSYGGLFTLYALLTRPELYQRYVAGDPSLWWHDGLLVTTTLKGFDSALAQDKKVLIMEGGRRSSHRTDDTRTQWSSHDFATKLQDQGVDVHYQQFSDLNHGQMLAASLKPALRLAATP